MHENSIPIGSAPTAIWSFCRREKAVLLLLAATFGLLAWQRWGMKRTVVLDPRSPGLEMSAVDDKVDNGVSVCIVHSSPDQWRLDYDVRPGGNWAYCGIRLTLRKPDGSPGMDFTRFDTLVVNLAGMTGTNQSLQVQMKALDTNIYKPGNDGSLKYQNMVLFSEHTGPSRNAMPLDRFVLPPWWVARNNVPVRFLNPDRNDVRQLEFLTSADVIRIGEGSVGIRSLELHGKWIDQQSLLRCLFGAWLVFVVGGLVRRLYMSLVSIRRLECRTTELQELAERDPLTRLRNRRGLENCLRGLAGNTLDPTNPVLGVLLIDLDRFKTINDTLGHDIGDEFLRILARIIQDEIRPTNLAARWGGEEFILLFPGISKARVAPVAEKLRARIESELHLDGAFLTASIGVSHGLVGDFDALVKQADEALYRAKTQGRNRVEIADPDS